MTAKIVKLNEAKAAQQERRKPQGMSAGGCSTPEHYPTPADIADLLKVQAPNIYKIERK